MDNFDDIVQTLERAGFWHEAAPAIGAARGLIDSGIDGDRKARLVNALSDAGARIFRGPDKTLGREAFSLAPIFVRASCLPSNIDVWHSYSDHLLKVLNELPENNSALSPLLRLMVAEGISVGLAQALARFIERVADIENAKIAPLLRVAEEMGSALCSAGWFDDPSTEIADALKRAVVTICRQDVVSTRTRSVRMLTILGFSQEASVPWATMLMECFVYPIMESPSEELGRIDLCLVLENIAYNFFVKKVETSTHFKSAYSRLKYPLIRDGLFVRSRLPPFLKGTHSPARVGFFLPSAAFLAHTQNLRTFLLGLVALPSKAIDPIIYVVGPRLSPIDDALGSLPFKIVYLWEEGELSPIDTYMRLRTEALSDGIAAMVFVSNVTGMCFLTAMRVAPVHIWWSMKYRGLTLPTLDGYMEMSHLFEKRRLEDGVTWFGCHAALPALTKPEAAPIAAQIRANSQLAEGTVVLACIGREEKLLNRGYARALGEVMRRCPNTEYIWTGRAQPPDFVSWLAEEGISGRCTFIGWVDTKIYAQVLDIYVDSFPFASGHTAFEAMAAGKPLLVLMTPEALETSTATAVIPVFEGRAGTEADQRRVREIFTAPDGSSLLPYVRTEEEYISQGEKLIKDAGFRNAVGKACQSFIEEFMRDEVRLAKSTCQNILDIINQAEAK